MPIDWTNYELTEAVNRMRPIRMRFADRYFTRRRNLPGTKVAIDFIKTPEGIMVALSTDAESKKAPRRSAERHLLETPRFSEHDHITFDDQNEYVAPGAIGGGQAFDQLVSDKLQDLRGRVDRTTEFLCVKALADGQAIDGDGNVLIDYQLPGIQTGIDLSTDDGLDIFTDAQRDVSRTLGLESVTLDAYLGEEAYKKLTKNPRVVSLLDGPERNQMLLDGVLRKVNGVNIFPVWSVYADNTGADQPWIADNDIIITSADAEFRLYYGAIAGPGGRAVMLPFWAEQEEIKDPNATKLRVEAKPLPVINRPEAVRRYQAA